MKRLKITLITISSILITFGVILGGFFIQGNCFLKSEPIKNTNLNSWMKNVDDETLLNEVIIPGSHDSGTYGMSYLGETQYLTIKEQLERGVRYFDLRVNKVKDKYKIYHSIINGVDFDPILFDLLDFIKNNQTETLILDFQHFKNNSQEYVLKRINELFDDYVITNDKNVKDLEFISSLKIKDCRGKCLFLFGDNCKYTIDNSHIFKRNDDLGTHLDASLDSYYYKNYHGLSSDEFINQGLPTYIDLIKNKIDKTSFKGLFVLQGQLTDTKLIFGPYNKERSHNDNMNEYINILKDKDYFHLINIVMRDFINEDKATDIIKLNNIKFNKDII